MLVRKSWSGSHRLGQLGWCEAAFSPAFEEKILEDRGEHEVVRDFAGRHVLYFKGRRQGFMPEYIDHPVKDKKTWEEDCKWRLNPKSQERCADLDLRMKKAVKCAGEGMIISQNLIGGYMYLRSLIGPVDLLYKFYDEPALIHDCMQTWLELADAVISKHQQLVTLDELFLAEDISYNRGPLISPDMMREFLFPYYQQLITNIKSRQIDQSRYLHIQIDTDGFANPLIPAYKEIGMDYMSPFEVASGCDVVEIGTLYPDMLIRGGIDKRILAEVMERYHIAAQNVSVLSIDTVVIGSGCAGFNAADTMYDLGKRDIALVTEGINMGTSRNTGSDKQTYYKLTLSSDCQDSIYDLAKDLFAGGGVNGDTALAEAAGSVRAFMKLVNMGVPFPTNIYGEHVGYKTDHDNRQRATSCGPLTSKIMVEKLECTVKSKGIAIFDHMQVVDYVVRDNTVKGIIAIETNRISETDMGLVVFNVNHVIAATGGPAGVYFSSVYPASQTGMSGIMLEAGAKAANLNEWQYGIASTKFRWNVSGTYQQVLPRYISIDKNGMEREFLPDYFDTPQQALDMVFLKGYQWPFDVKKIEGSSLIDMIMHHEIFHKGNRVFMDFRTDPAGLENGFDGICDTALQYLKNSHALVPTPIKRLEIMNKKAVELYATHHIDLNREMLEVSVCAQHNNGGISVDLHWESSIKGLYVAGEAAGTFGVYRPGGAALNSTQVGSMRAAQHISGLPYKQLLSPDAFMMHFTGYIEEYINRLRQLVNKDRSGSTVQQKISLQKQMSEIASHVRDLDRITKWISDLENKIAVFFQETSVAGYTQIPPVLKLRDIMIMQMAILSAMKTCGEIMGSRGSAIVLNKYGKPVHDKIPYLRYKVGTDELNDSLITTSLHDNKAGSAVEKVRPLPETNDWFENTWKEYAGSAWRPASIRNWFNR